MLKGRCFFVILKTAFKTPMFVRIPYFIRLALLFLFLLSVDFSLAQSGEANQHSVKIRFEGLNRTRETFVRRFLVWGEDGQMNETHLKRSCELILNTGFFSEVGFVKEESMEGDEIVFSVKEKWTLLPSFNGGATPENKFIEFGVLDFHFMGMGGMLGVFYRYYDKSAFQVLFNQPYIGRSKWGFNLLAENYVNTEPIYISRHPFKYNLNRYHYYLAGSVELAGLHTALLPGFGYRSEVFNLNDDADGVLPEREIQDGFYVSLKWVDSRRLIQDVVYQKGFAWQVSAELPVFSSDKKNYMRLGLENRVYGRMGDRGNIAGRLRLNWVENYASAFAPLYHDDFENLRGSGHRSDRGTAEVSVSLEYRQVVWENSWLVIQPLIFSDISTLRPPGASVNDWVENGRVRCYAGPGLRLNFTQVSGSIIRADYGFAIGEKGSGLVVGVNHFF